MSKEITFSTDVRTKLLKGIEKGYRAVTATLGPRGRNVVIEKSFGSPKITKDGVSVIKELELEDKIENIGIQILKESANKSNDKAGDGTTTCIELTSSMIREGIKFVGSGMNPMDVRRGMSKAEQSVIKSIKEMSQDINHSNHEQIKQVATISANGDTELGAKIAEGFQKVGPNGILTVEEASKNDSFEVDIVEGFNFDRGFISGYFATNTEKMICEFENPYILVFEKKISNIQQILPLLESVLKTSKPFLIIAEDVENEALSTLIVNKIRAGLKVAAVKAPGFGDRRKAMLEDIAIATGAKFISEELGDKLENVTLNDLGVANKVLISKDDTVIIKGQGKPDEINKRCNQIKSQLETESSDYEKEKLNERLACLAGKVGVLKVGGLTEIEVKEKKDLVEDAYHATKAALEEGIVPGGGAALLYALQSLSSVKGLNQDEDAGIQIVRQALGMPMRKILKNAALPASYIMEGLKKQNNIQLTYDAQNMKEVDAFKAGIIDPTKIVRTSFQSAISSASSLIMTEVVVTDLPKKNDEAVGGGGMPGGMPGMGM